MGIDMHRIYGLLAGLAVTCAAQSAFADVTYTKLSAPADSVEARIGREKLSNGSLGDQWLVWKRRSNGSCIGNPIRLGGTGGMSKNYLIEGSNAGDLFVVQSAYETHCGKKLGPLKYGGNQLVLSAKDGNDVLLGTISSSGSLSLFGGKHDDIVAASGVDFLAMGEGGNDDVEAWGAGSTQYLYGDGHNPGETTGPEGADCLWASTHQAYSVACYGNPAGTQDKASFPSSWKSVGCEVQNTSVCCTWAHFVGAC